MLINLQALLQTAERQRIAYGSFNVYNVESLQAVLEAAHQVNEPAIIAFGAAYEKHMPLEAMAELVKYYAAPSDIPFVLHLDHCKQKETILRALRAGFTSVMFDGSSLPLAENIARSRDVASCAHEFGASLEGELGYMNPEDGSSVGPADPASYTSPEDAGAYAAASGADALAIAIGNAHGLYQGKPDLDIRRLSEIHEAVALPLVLHGSSGIPLELLQRAIRHGIRKININTEVSTAGIQAAREFLAGHTDPNTRFEAMTKHAERCMAKVVSRYMTVFHTADEEAK